MARQKWALPQLPSGLLSEVTTSVSLIDGHFWLLLLLLFNSYFFILFLEMLLVLNLSLSSFLRLTTQSLSCHQTPISRQQLIILR